MKTSKYTFLQLLSFLPASWRNAWKSIEEGKSILTIGPKQEMLVITHEKAANGYFSVKEIEKSKDVVIATEEAFTVNDKDFVVDQRVMQMTAKIR